MARKQMYTLRELADILRMSNSSVLYKLEKNKIRPSKIDGLKTLYKKEVIEKIQSEPFFDSKKFIPLVDLAKKKKVRVISLQYHIAKLNGKILKMRRKEDGKLIKVITKSLQKKVEDRMS